MVVRSSRRATGAPASGSVVDQHHGVKTLLERPTHVIEAESQPRHSRGPGFPRLTRKTQTVFRISTMAESAFWQSGGWRWRSAGTPCKVVLPTQRVICSLVIYFDTSKPTYTKATQDREKNARKTPCYTHPFSPCHTKPHPYPGPKQFQLSILACCCPAVPCPVSHPSTVPHPSPMNLETRRCKSPNNNNTPSRPTTRHISPLPPLLLLACRHSTLAAGAEGRRTWVAAGTSSVAGRIAVVVVRRALGCSLGVHRRHLAGRIGWEGRGCRSSLGRRGGRIGRRLRGVLGCSRGVGLGVCSARCDCG